MMRLAEYPIVQDLPIIYFAHVIIYFFDFPDYTFLQCIGFLITFTPLENHITNPC